MRAFGQGGMGTFNWIIHLTSGVVGRISAIFTDRFSTYLKINVRQWVIVNCKVTRVRTKNITWLMNTADIKCRTLPIYRTTLFTILFMQQSMVLKWEYRRSVLHSVIHSPFICGMIEWRNILTNTISVTVPQTEGLWEKNWRPIN